MMVSSFFFRSSELIEMAINRVGFRVFRSIEIFWFFFYSFEELIFLKFYFKDEHKYGYEPFYPLNISKNCFKRQKTRQLLNATPREFHCVFLCCRKHSIHSQWLFTSNSSTFRLAHMFVHSLRAFGINEMRHLAPLWCLVSKLSFKC